MRKTAIKFLFIFLALGVVSGVVTTPQIVVADADYTVLTPLPGTTKGDCTKPGDAGCKTDLKTYVEGAFKLAIGISIAFVLINFIIGGFQYITSQAMGGKKDGRERIENSIKGLVLVAASWLILYTINPSFTNINFRIDAIDYSTGPTGNLSAPGRAMTQAEESASKAVRQQLIKESNENISIYKDECTEGQTTKCVNLNGLTPKAITGILNLQKTVNSKIEITGGTESGHSATGGHSDGKSLDVSFNTKLDEYILSKDKNPVKSNYKGYYLYTAPIDNKGTMATFLRETDPPHWHITFP
jgi:hypothetical protein